MAYLLITIEESNECLANKQDWLDLDDDNKAAHIQNASYYVATRWDCNDINWRDEALELDDDIKCAIAHYAYHDLQGTLYGSADSEKEANIKIETLVAGSLDGSVEYFSKGKKYAHLDVIDTVFKANGCNRSSFASVDLVRV